MQISGYRCISVSTLCLALLSLTCCGMLYEYQGVLRSKSYLYSFGKDGSGSLPRYSLSVSSDTTRHPITKSGLDCGIASGAVEFRFTLEKTVLLLWWSSQDGKPGYPCYAAFQDTAAGLVSHDSTRELELLVKAADYFRIKQAQGQPKENLKHSLQNVAIKRNLIPLGTVFGYVEVN